tara:strand:+ start:151 stop:726 length:576 start_codon:yes stop_codon:yes gene_type:complete
MSDSELFDMPEKPKKKRVMSEEQKEVLRERLKLAREKKRLNRESKSKPKLTSIPEKDEVEPPSPHVTSDDETHIDLSEPNLDIPDDNETDILKLQMDIEDLNMKLKKNKKQKTTARQIIYNRNRKAKQASDIERLVNEKVNQKLSQKTAPQATPQSVMPPPKPTPVIQNQPLKPPPVPRIIQPLGRRKPMW